MKTIVAMLAVLTATITLAQTCPVPLFPSPPKAVNVNVRFTNPDGGSRPCSGTAGTPGGQPPKDYQMSNTDCDRLKKLGDWAVEQDNGWGDGGVP